MSFCINYWSHRNTAQQSRFNPDNTDRCLLCGTSLLLQNHYRVLRSLRDPLPYSTTHYEVFEVQDQTNGKRKVLKTLVESNNPTLVTHFEREAQVLRDLAGSESCVPKGEDAFEISLDDPDHSSLPCLIMEWIEGINLEMWVEQHGQIRDLSKALNWLDQLTNILSLIHGRGLVHRDLKPSNIMWREDGSEHGQLVLIDFGTVKTAETQLSPSSQTEINSSGYSAKEVRAGNSVWQSDFFSLGRTFIYLMTGQHPYYEDEQWERNAEDSLRHPQLIDLINDLMADRWQNRPRSTEEIANRVAQIRRALHLPPKNLSIPAAWSKRKITQTSPPPVPTIQRRTLFIPLMVSAVLAAIFVIPLLEWSVLASPLRRHSPDFGDRHPPDLGNRSMLNRRDRR